MINLPSISTLNLPSVSFDYEYRRDGAALAAPMGMPRNDFFYNTNPNTLSIPSIHGMPMQPKSPYSIQPKSPYSMPISPNYYQREYYIPQNEYSSRTPSVGSPSEDARRPITPRPSATPSLEEVSSETSETNDTNEETTAKSWKPRKKRQCPECKLFFLNLATHKSTHLKPTNRPHICKYCSRGFARPNDLFRHVKCHWKEIGSDSGQFKCPYKGELCCHSTGIFSRCDTFKNHLKAIHFQYPLGTKKENRSKVAGKCRQCQMEFSSVDTWLVDHIEKKDCKYIEKE